MILAVPVSEVTVDIDNAGVGLDPAGWPRRWPATEHPGIWASGRRAAGSEQV